MKKIFSFLLLALSLNLFAQQNGLNLSLQLPFTQNTHSVIPMPAASFSLTPTFGATPLSVHFYDQSTNTPTSWHWNVTGGTVNIDYSFTTGSATSQNPVMTFSTMVTYSVTLTATNAGGSNTSAQQTINCTFNAANYGTVLTWLHNGANITLNSGAISIWGDNSGNGNNASQSTAASQPTYTASAMNGNPCAIFDGVNDFFTFGTSLGKPKYFCEVSVMFTNSSITNQRFSGGYDGINAGTLWQGTSINNTIGDGVISAYNSDGVNFSISNTATLTVASLTPVSMTLRYRDGQTTLDFFKNGISIMGNSFVSNASTNTGTAPNFSIGRFGDLSSSYFNGYLAEYIMFGGSSLSAIPTNAQVLSIYNALKTKFGLP